MVYQVAASGAYKYAHSFNYVGVAHIIILIVVKRLTALMKFKIDKASLLESICT